MTAFRALVTGSRSWPDEQAVWDVLDGFRTGATAGGYTGLVVVHGAAKGADLMAYRWARDRAGRRGWAVEHEPHPADWSMGRQAGVARNAQMITLGADVVLAFLVPCSDKRCTRRDRHESHGATHCADLAERTGLHVERFRAPTSELAAQVPLTLPDSKETNHA